MATGDVDGNIDRLKLELRRTKYSADLDETGLRLGEPGAALPILQHIFLNFSRHVSQDLVANGYELQGKSPERFVETGFKAIREHYGLRPVITVAQFLEKGFAERKVMLLHDLIGKCVAYHNEAVRLHRMANGTTQQMSYKRGEALPGTLARAPSEETSNPELRSTIIRHSTPGSHTITQQSSPCRQPLGDLNFSVTEAGPLYRKEVEVERGKPFSSGMMPEQQLPSVPGGKRLGTGRAPNRPSSARVQGPRAIKRMHPSAGKITRADHDWAQERSQDDGLKWRSESEEPRPCVGPVGQSREAGAGWNWESSRESLRVSSETEQLSRVLQSLLHSLHEGHTAEAILAQLSASISGLQARSHQPAPQKSPLEELQQRQLCLEEEMRAVKSAAEQSKQHLQARIVVLETRLRAWEGVQQHPIHHPLVNSYARKAAACQLVGGGASSCMASQPPSSISTPYKSWAPVSFEHRREEEGFHEAMPHTSGGASRGLGNWAGYESTEKLIQDIQNRYAEAQKILQQHSALS